MLSFLLGHILLICTKAVEFTLIAGNSTWLDDFQFDPLGRMGWSDERQGILETNDGRAFNYHGQYPESIKFTRYFACDTASTLSISSSIGFDCRCNPTSGYLTVGQVGLPDGTYTYTDAVSSKETMTVAESDCGYNGWYVVDTNDNIIGAAPRQEIGTEWTINLEGDGCNLVIYDIQIECVLPTSLVFSEWE